MLLPHQSTDAASASATSSGLMDELRRNKAAFATVTSSPLGEERLRGGGDDETEITTTTTLPLPPLNANKTLAFPQQKRSRESTEAVMATDKDLDDALLKENTARKTKRTRRKSSRLHPTTPVLYPNNCDSSPSKLKWKYWKLTTTTTHVADNRPALAVRIPRTPVLFKRTAINTFTDNDTNSIKHCVQDEADSDLMLPIPGPESPDIRGESYFLSAAAESSSSSQLQQLRQQQRCHGLGEVLMGDMEEEKKEAVMVQEKFAVDDEHLEIFTTPSSIPSSPPPPPLYNNITMDVHDLHPPPTSSAPLVLQQHQEYQQLPSFTPSSFPLIDCCNTAATVDNDASQQLVDDDDESEDEGIVNNDTNIDSSSSANLIVFSTAREDTRSQQTYTPNRSNDNIINPDDQCNYEHIDGDSQLPDSPLQFTQNEQMNSDDEGENQRLQHQLQLQSQPVLFTTTSTNYTNGDEMEEGCGIEVEADMFMEFGGGGGDRVLVRISEGGDAEESNEYLEGRDSVAANPTHPVNAPAVSTITAPLATTTTTTTVAATAISSIESEITHDDLLLLSNLSAQDGFALDSSNGGGGGGFSSGGSHDSAIVVAKKGKEDHEEAVGMAPGAASVSNGVASGGSGGGKGEDSEEWGFFDSQVERQIHAATQGYNQVKMPPPCFLNDRIPPPPNFMDVDNSNTEKHVRDDNNIDLSSALAPPPPSTSSSLFTTAASINSNNVIKVTAPFPSFDNPASSRTVAAAEGNDLFVLASRIPFVSDQGRLAADGTGVENIVKPLVPPPPRIQLPSMKIAGCSSARNPDPISLLKKIFGDDDDDDMKDLLSTAVSSARPTVISFASGGKDKECDQDMEIDTMVGFQTAAGGAGAVGGNDRFVGFATPVVKRVNPAVAPQSSASFSSFSLTSASTSVCTPAPSSYSLKTHVQPPLHQQVLPASVGFTDFATPKPIALLNNVTSSSSSIPGTSGQLRPFQKPMPYTPIKTGSNGVGPLSSLSALKQPQRRISSTIIIPKTSTSNCNNIGLISNTESKEIMQTCNTFSYPSPIPSSTTTYSTNSPSGMFSTLGSSYSSSLLQTPAPVFGRRKPLLATSVGGSGSSTPSKFIPPKFKPKTPSGGGGIGGALMSSVSSTPSTSKHVSKVYPPLVFDPLKASKRAYSMAELRQLNVPDAVFRIFQFQHEAVSYNFPTTQLELDPSESSSDTNQDSGRAGHVELRTRLLASGIVPNPDVMSDKWVRNHYGLILWKLARYYLYFPFDFASWWSLDRVYAQLVHRFLREYTQASRSPLRRIIEKDDTPAKYMILAVCSIHIVNREARIVNVELTDGWYKINAALDPILTDAVCRLNILTGDKLAVCGAKVIGDNGPTTALEAPNSLQLQLFANSTRQAPWDARLGFVPEQGFKLSLKGVLASGGNIPCLDIVIMRIYPLVYFEYPKEGGGKIVVRTERDERIAERAWENQREHLRRSKSINAMTVASNRPRTTRGSSPSRSDLESMDASDLYSAYQSTAQENEFISRLSAGQQQSLKGYIAQQGVEEAQNLEDEIEEAFPARKVTAMLKIKVCDYLPPSVDPRWVPTEAILTIRRPAEGLVEMLKEGHRFEIYRAESDKQYTSCKISISIRDSSLIQPREMENGSRSLYCPRSFVSPFDLLSTGLSYAQEVDVACVTLASLPLDQIASGCHRKLLLATDSISDQTILVELRSQTEFSVTENILYSKPCIFIFKNLVFQKYMNVNIPSNNNNSTSSRTTSNDKTNTASIPRFFVEPALTEFRLHAKGSMERECFEKLESWRYQMSSEVGLRACQYQNILEQCQ